MSDYTSAPPAWKADATGTPHGWINTHTGELLVATKHIDAGQITAATPATPWVGTANTTTNKATLLNVQTTSGVLAVGQVLTGTGMPAGTFVQGIADAVGSVTITGGGTGYVQGAAVVFTGGGGQGAAGTLNVTDGVVDSITMTSYGFGYTSAPVVSAPTGADLVASAVLTGTATMCVPATATGTAVDLTGTPKVAEIAIEVTQTPAMRTAYGIGDVPDYLD